MQTEIAKHQYKFFKDQINVNNSNRKGDAKTEDDDNRVDDTSDESNITKEFDAILKDMKNNGRTTKSMSVKSRGKNINLHLLIIKLPYAEKNSIILGQIKAGNSSYKLQN